MKARIYEWHTGEEDLKRLGYTKGQEVDLIRALKKAYNAGFNVAVLHGKDNSNILFINQGRFTQS